jgi:hypothetical protein
VVPTRMQDAHRGMRGAIDKLLEITQVRMRNCHTPVLRRQNRSFRTCAQAVQITPTANNMVNRYNISINYKLKSYKMTLGSERKLQASSNRNLSIGAASMSTTGGAAGQVFVF